MTVDPALPTPALHDVPHGDLPVNPAVLEWLLDTDPALRWQVERDLADAPPEVWQTTRARVANEGFGAQLLALQDSDGQWDGGSYYPGGFDFDGPDFGGDAGQPWTATTWSLSSLREWGVNAGRLSGTAELLAANSRWEYNNRPYWEGEVDCCGNAQTLANGGWLGADVTGLARWFVDHQMSEGGWNCDWVEGATRASFHSTLNSLRGILAYEETLESRHAPGASAGDAPDDPGLLPGLRDARKAGEEYLLQRQLRRRLSTSEPVAPWVDTFVYPFRWFYSVINAADYFRGAALHDGDRPDPRLAEAVEVIRAAREPDGRWIQQHRHPGRAWFEVDVEPGQPSPWLTFLGTRVLTWWDEAAA
jgi:hypothetical protein